MGRYQSSNYNLGETAYLSRTFEPGDTVTVRVRNLDTDAAVTLTTGTATESSTEPGKYDWDTSDLDTQPTSYINYEVTFEDSEGQTASQKITFGGYVDQTSINTYQGAVWIDTVNGSSGQGFPVGTPNNPSDNEADAFAIATALGFNKFVVIGSLTLNNTYNNWTFMGGSSALNDVIDVNGEDVNDSTFQDVTVTGAMGGSTPKNVTFTDVRISAVTGFDGVTQRGGVITSFGLAAGGTLQALETYVDGLTATIDANGSSNISWANLKGLVTFQNFTGGLLLLSIDDAIVTLDNSNTGGTYVVAGRGTFADNSATMTGLLDESLSRASIADAVADEPLAGHVTAGTTGEAWNYLDADISSREAESDAATRAATNQSEHDDTQADIAALNNIDIADVQTALDNQGYTAARASNLDNLDDSISNVIAAISALNNPSAADIADAVWDELISGHTSAGTFGEKVNRGEVLEETTTIAGSTTSQIRTNLNEANGYWNGTIVEVTLPSGNRVTRVVNSYTLTNGALNVLTTLPETPGTGAAVRILKPVPRLVNSAITASTISASAIGATQLATNAITAAKIAADAIGASELATDAINEIVAAIDAAQVLASTTTIAGSTTTEIRTNLTQADNYWNDHYVEVTLPSGSRVTRAINAYANTNGAITVETLPETPGTGAVVKILRQRGRLSNQGQKDVGIKVQQRLGTLRI